MSGFLWVLHDPSGKELRTTGAFSSREDAEAWMSEKWAELLAEGAESVTLERDGDALYRMGLREV